MASSDMEPVYTRVQVGEGLLNFPNVVILSGVEEPALSEAEGTPTPSHHLRRLREFSPWSQLPLDSLPRKPVSPIDGGSIMRVLQIHSLTFSFSPPPQDQDESPPLPP